MRVLINLIGEQPIPNLLPILFLKPEKTIFLYTKTTERRARLLKENVPNSEIREIDPYDFNFTLDKLSKEFNDHDDFICNFTGGTKIMSQCLFQLSLAYKAEIIYLQSEGNSSFMHKYSVNSENNLSHEIINLPELINVEDYLKAHIPYFDKFQPQNDTGGRFEKAVCNILMKNGFEVIQSIKPRGEGNQLEIDAAIRLISRKIKRKIKLNYS